MLISEMPHPKKKLTPIQSIKFYCKNLCCAGDLKSWKECPAIKCSLYQFRLGKRPKKLPFEHYTRPKSHINILSEKQVVLPIDFTKNQQLKQQTDTRKEGNPENAKPLNSSEINNEGLQ